MKRLALLVLLLFATPAHATVNEVFARNEYVVAGSGTVFPYTFKILDKVQLTVMVNGVIKNLDTDYSVSGVGDSGGGAVTFITTPGNGASVVLIRDQPVQQLSTYTANEAFPATRLMNDLDKNIMVDQMQQEEIGRALKFDPYSLFKDVFIDTPVAGKCLAWNSARTRVINADCAAGSGGGGELPPGLVTGSALPGQVTFWSGANTIAGDTKFLWDNSTKALTVGTTPLGGPLKPGNVFIGLQAPSDATGMQALMVQTYQGAPGLAGLVTLGDDRVGISSWNFRGTGATNPIYGANFGVVFNTPGVANGLEIDVQNDSTTNYIGQALWLNGSTRATGTPGTVGHRANAILIDTQDGSKWERGILFKEGFVGNGATGSIEKMGIHFEHSQDADFIVIQPRVGQSANIAFKLTNPEFTVNRFELLNSGAIRVGTTMTGPAFPSYAFVEEQTTGMYLESPSVLGFAISGPLVPGPGVGGFRRMTLGTALNIYPSAATPSNTGTLNLWDQFSAHSVGFMAPDFVGNSFRIRLPNAPGFSGQCLVTNGAFPIETWSYAACGSGGPGGGTVTNTGVLTLNALILGDGGVAVKPMSSLGTTTTVLHGNASGVPTFGPVLVPDIGATGTPSATTFLRGDGTWSTPPGTGTVTTSGSPVSGQVAFMTSSTAISGAPELTWSGAQVLTVGTGTSISLYSNKPALLNDVKHGTEAAPVTILGPTVKISKVQNYTTLPMAGCTTGTNGEIDPECGATLMVYNQSLVSSQQQGTAIAGYAFGDNTGTGGGSGDQTAFFGIGRKAGGLHGGGNGAYFEGQRFVAGTGTTLSTNAVSALGAELRSSNFTATDCAFATDVAGLTTCASLLLSAGGTVGKATGAGALAFDSANSPGRMLAGYVCTQQSVGASGACFDDYSAGSAYGIRIGGTKLAAIRLDATAPIGIDATNLTGTVAMRMKTNLQIQWSNAANTDTIYQSGDGDLKVMSMGSDLHLHRPLAGGTSIRLYNTTPTNYAQITADSEALSIGTTISTIFQTRVSINNLGQFTFIPTPTVGSFQLAANGTRRTELQFFTNSNTNAVSLIAPATATGNHVWTLPSTFGAAGEVLTNTGGGVLAWTASGGVTGSGTANRIGYWSGASTLTSAAGFTFDGAAMTIPGNLLATALTPDVSSSNPRLIVTEGASTPVGDVTAWRPYMRFILNNTATDRKSAIYIESINTGAPVSASRVNSGIQIFHASAQDNGGEVSGISSVQWLDGNAGTFQRNCSAVGGRPGSLPACATSRAAGFSLEINGSGNMSNAISGSLDTTSTVISYAASVNSPGTGALQPAGFVAFTANDTLNLHLREAIRVMGTGLETTGAYSAAAVRFLVTMDGATRVGPSLANMGQGTINTSVGYYTNNAAPVMPSLAGADLRLVTVSASGQLGAAAIVAGISTTIAVRNSADTGSCTIGFVGGIAVSTTC